VPRTCAWTVHCVYSVGIRRTWWNLKMGPCARMCQAHQGRDCPPPDSAKIRCQKVGKSEKGRILVLSPSPSPTPPSPPTRGPRRPSDGQSSTATSHRGRAGFGGYYEGTVAVSYPTATATAALLPTGPAARRHVAQHRSVQQREVSVMRANTGAGPAGSSPGWVPMWQRMREPSSLVIIG
jgi:hypothetical protein